MKKALLTFLIIVMCFSLSGCYWNELDKTEKDGIFRVTMAPDLGGINDQSFDQSAWEGLNEFKQQYGQNVEISYVESKQSSDFAMVLDRMSDQNFDLIWGIGCAMSDAVFDTASMNLDKNFAIIDYSYGEKTPNNVTGILFRSEESAFLVGYVAGRSNKTGKVGFIGGMKNAIVYQFDFGFKAGVEYAAKEIGKNIEIETQYAESFTDAAKGKAIANKMFSDGCDIIFHAAGVVGYGAIESAKDQGKYIIGVDRDQSYLAPDNILTSALKNVGQAVKLVSEKIMNGENLGGTTQVFGSKEGCAGIPEVNKNLDPNIYKDTMALNSKIVDGTILLNGKKVTIPYDDITYQKYLEDIK